MAPPTALIRELQGKVDHLSSDRRTSALRHLTDLYLVSGHQLSGDELRLIDDIFVRLVEAVELSARALLAINGAAQIRAARHIMDKGLSVRETERLVKQQNEPTAKASKAPQGLDPDTQRLQDELSERLGAKVQFQTAKGGKGKLVIQYNSLDELDGILDHIK